MTDKELVCYCFAVEKERILKIIREKRTKSVEEVQQYCEACMGCGGCRWDIEDLIKEEGLYEPVKLAKLNRKNKNR